MKIRQILVLTVVLAGGCNTPAETAETRREFSDVEGNSCVCVSSDCRKLACEKEAVPSDTCLDNEYPCFELSDFPLDPNSTGSLGKIHLCPQCCGNGGHGLIEDCREVRCSSTRECPPEHYGLTPSCIEGACLVERE
jgi:hypothetical protein